MTQFDDALILEELKRLLVWQDPDAPFVETIPELIIPALGSGYAKNPDGHVVGIKLGYQHATQKTLSHVLRFAHLQRLTFYSREDVKIPAAIGQLTELRVVALGGSIRRLPPELLKLRLPIYSVHDLEAASDEIAREFGTVGISLERAVQSLIDTDGGLEGGKERRRGVAQLEETIAQSVRGFSPVSLRDAIIRAASVTGSKIRGEEADYVADALMRVLRTSDHEGIFLSLEELEDPPLEIVAKGREAVDRYFQARDEGELPLSEVKVLLVGHGSAGKTSLVKRIFGEEFDQHESQTHGISIRRWSTNASSGHEIKANFWDFGGQEIMHATHQFFLSKRSLYILLLDGRKEEDPEYWLQHIESFGGDSPVLVVLNKIDQHPAFDVNRLFLRQKYRGIVGFHRVSCATGDGIEHFAKALEAQLETVPILQTRWPHSWFRVKQELETDETAYISLAAYTALCEREGVTDPASQETLVDFLNDLGVILHFKDLELIDTHVLDPRWVTEAVYRIINSPALAAQKGFLELAQLAEILAPWDGATFMYPASKHRYIIDLMLKFELCYEVAANAVLVPDLLDVQQPSMDFDTSNALEFIFEYAYLPTSVLPRFIVRMHRDIVDGNAWRTGVLLSDKVLGASALVTADTHAKRIRVVVQGTQRRDYFATIRKVVTEINTSFEKLVFTEFVPLPDFPTILIDYRELIGYELDGRTDIFIGRLGRSYQVTKLLNGIEAPSTREPAASHTIVNVTGDYITNSTIGTSGQSMIIVGQTPSPEERKMVYQPQTWERIVAYAAAVLFLGVVSFIAIRNEPIADPNIVVLIRTVLSLVVAVIGATVPGMLHVDMSRKGLAIRATGALALFVITFMLTPQVMPQGALTP
jgi:small GTP-binding protein